MLPLLFRKDWKICFNDPVASQMTILRDQQHDLPPYQVASLRLANELLKEMRTKSGGFGRGHVPPKRLAQKNIQNIKG